MTVSTERQQTETGSAAQLTLATLIDDFRTRGDDVAILQFGSEGKRQISFSELRSAADHIAAGLVNRSVKHGEPVMMCAENSIEWLTCCMGIILSGAVVVPTDPAQGDEQLKHIGKDSGVKIAFVDERSAERLTQLGFEEVRQYRLDKTTGRDSYKNLEAPPKKTRRDVGPDDIAMLYYTSGTTGEPKGVPLKHSNITMQLECLVAKADLLKRGDRLLLPLPLFHVYPLNVGTFYPLLMGLPLILPASLTGPEILRAINEGKATVMVGVPRLLRALYTAIESKFDENKILKRTFAGLMQVSKSIRALTGVNIGRSLFAPVHKKFGPTLRLFCCGGAPLDPDLAMNLSALGWKVAVGYGLTETAPLLTMRMPDNFALESVGKPIQGVKVRITKIQNEEEGSRSNTDEGEIEATGPNVFEGYFHLKKKNDEAFSNDGWFKTGDVGYLKDGNLFITGRANTTIVLEGGKKVHPDHLEDRFSKVSGIKEIGLLAINQRLSALIVPDESVLKSSSAGSEEKASSASLKSAVSNLLASESAKLPNYQRIIDFAITREPLPRTNLGKIKHHELEARFEQAKKAVRSGMDDRKKGAVPVDEMPSADQALLREPIALQCWNWFVEKYPNEYLSLDTNPQLDLNIDSLEWLNLSLEIQQMTGFELGEDVIGRVQSIRDLLNELVEISRHKEKSEGSPIEDPMRFIDEKQKRWLEPHTKIESVMAWFIYKLDLFLCLLFRVTAVGAENIPDRHVVFIPNHASYIDIFVLVTALGLDRARKTQIAGWAGIAFNNPANVFVSRLAWAIPIDAKKSLLTSLALPAAVLKRKRNLIWFPEGERTLDGELIKFRPGIGYLLEKLDVEAVPVFLEGVREALPPGAFFPKFRQIKVHFGQPVDAGTLERQGKGNTTPEKIADALQQRVQALADAAEKKNPFGGKGKT